MGGRPTPNIKSDDEIKEAKKLAREFINGGKDIEAKSNLAQSSQSKNGKQKYSSEQFEKKSFKLKTQLNQILKVEAVKGTHCKTEHEIIELALRNLFQSWGYQDTEIS